MTEHESPATVLIVEDEPSLADLYTTWLEPEYAVTAVSNGTAALDVVDESVDVVLADRQMPKLSGDELIDRLDQRGYDCRSAMITAIDPDFDILDIACDEYLTKPVSQQDVCTTVDRLLRLDTYDEQLQAYFTLVSKKAALDAEKSAATLAESHEYEELIETIAEQREHLEETLATFDDDEFIDLVRDIDSSAEPLTGGN